MSSDDGLTEADKLGAEFEALKLDIEQHEARWKALLVDVEAGIHHRNRHGGQQAGTPAFASAPISMLLRLRNECRSALKESR